MVAQEDDFGCGVACLANLLRIPYDSALKLFAKPARAKGQGYLCKEVVAALSKADLDYEFKYIKPKLRKSIYKQGYIVFIKRSCKYPAGHYLLRIKNGWADSWLNFPQSPRTAGIRERLPGKPIYLIRSK